MSETFGALSPAPALPRLAAGAGATFNILIVEDDPATVELLSYHLRKEGFGVFDTDDGEHGLILARDEKPDLMILDWMIPGMSGIELCRAVRGERAIAGLPIVMLTGRSSEADRVRGLENGADDYVTKPFSPRELIARVNAVLRHRRPLAQHANLQYAGIVMDTVACRVSRDGIHIALGPTEFRLLRHLLEHPGRVFSRKQLFFAVWSASNAVEERTVDAYIRRLRKAINRSGQSDLIRTVRYAGYSLDSTPSERAPAAA